MKQYPNQNIQLTFDKSKTPTLARQHLLQHLLQFFSTVCLLLLPADEDFVQFLAVPLRSPCRQSAVQPVEAGRQNQFWTFWFDFFHQKQCCLAKIINDLQFCLFLESKTQVFEENKINGSGGTFSFQKSAIFYRSARNVRRNPWNSSM